VEREGTRGQDLVAIACGANMNFDRLRFVAERAEIGEQREALLAVTIPERPAASAKFCRAARRAQHHRVQLPLSPTPTAPTCSSACRWRGARSRQLVATLRATATARST
jgi:hypothetical protein